MTDKLLTVTELCETLQITRRSIQNLRKMGMPEYKLSVNGRPRFDLEEVKAWMRENVEKSRVKQTV